MLSYILDFIEYVIRLFIVFVTNYLPVKVIRDNKGVPFLYRYHVLTLWENGPGICIHRFVKSDPERGYHDHPWKKSFSFILCGGYEERILNHSQECGYIVHKRSRWCFNYLDGVNVFHRVIIEEGKDAWTLFFFQRRSKTWGMVSLNGKYKVMNPEVIDRDGDWWKTSQKGLSIHSHVKHPGKVLATVDSIIIADCELGKKVLLIKRGKNPYKDCWAFPGGRIEQKDENILAAAYRELKEETNLINVNLEYFKTIGNSSRDPRGFCLTNVFIGKLEKIPEIGIKAGDDAVDYEWFDLNNLPDMAFDHKEILLSI